MSNEMKKYEIKLKSKTIIGEDYYVFDFYVPEGIEFKAGQYGVFQHVDKEITGRKVRAFSIASSADEDVFKVALKIIEEPSDFKAKMRDLEIGEPMAFTGPMGHFTLEEEYDCVLICGGIGSTPIRGLVKQMQHMDYRKKAELVYSEPREIYPFKDEFDNMDFLVSHYKSSIDNTKEAIAACSTKFNNHAFYYVSGSPGFVSSVKEQLTGNNVDESHIKYDRFTGY